MNIEQKIELNLFGQGLINVEKLKDTFNMFNEEYQRQYLEKLILLIIQSKPLETDLDNAIIQSKIKSTFTPCVILKNGLIKKNFIKVLNLPKNELDKAFIILVYIFKIAYLRKFEIEKNNPTKWWFWDFTEENNLKKLDLVKRNIIY